MIRTIRRVGDVFAPGKLFVVGEYAVLEGGRALVVAVDAGIRCRLEAASENTIHAPDLAIDSTFAAARTDPRAALPVAVAEAAMRAFGVAGPIAITVRADHAASCRKLGLGGSAATVAAVAGAVAVAAGEDLRSASTRRRIFEVALGAHRARQRGRGSGADVAAAVYGGWVDYALAEGGPMGEATDCLSGGDASPRPVKWIVPARLPAFEFAAVWTGVSADTASAIAHWETPAGGASIRPAADGGRLRAILDRFWSAVGRSDRDALFTAVSEYGRALDALAGDDAGARRTREVVAAAEAAGAAAKGSGAVGGDSAIALARDAAGRDAVVHAWRALGAEVLEVAVDVAGVRELAAHA